eukprot:13249145-Alexandrium_andersonii.AAC.1
MVVAMVMLLMVMVVITAAMVASAEAYDSLWILALGTGRMQKRGRRIPCIVGRAAAGSARGRAARRRGARG